MTAKQKQCLLAYLGYYTGQLKKVLTDDVCAVLEKYGVKG